MNCRHLFELRRFGVEVCIHCGEARSQTERQSPYASGHAHDWHSLKVGGMEQCYGCAKTRRQEVRT